MADDAPDRSARDGVTARHMSRHGTDSRALQATLRTTKPW
jgi:hypothetical protein